MNTPKRNTPRKLALAASACAYTLATLASAAPGPISDVPLATQGGLPPNLMIMLDSSGSMDTRLPYCGSGCPRPTRLDVVKGAAKGLIDDLPDDRIRVGLSSFNGEVGARIRHNLVALSAAQKTDIKDKINDIQAQGWTPLAEAASDIGRYFSYGYTGRLTLHPNDSFGVPEDSTRTVSEIFQNEPAYITDLSAPQRAVQQYCQKNFFMLLTDGLPTKDKNVSSYLQDYDNDGRDNCSGSGCPSYSDDGSDYLDDVTTAMFDMDLRPDLVGPNPSRPVKNNVTTYMVGFADGSLANNPLLKSAAEQAGGQYLYASDSDALQQAFRSILSDIFSKVGSSSAAAFNATALHDGANLYLASYNSENWSGELQSRRINADGSIDRIPQWKASEEIPVPNNRVILTARGGSGAVFDPDLLGAAPMTEQELDLRRNTATASNDNRAADRLQYIRGNRSGEGRTSDRFRERGSALGDIVNSTPVFVGAPQLNLPDLDPFGADGDRYSDFAEEAGERKGVVYIGANDGMLHGFDAETGEELIAYVPELLLSAENARGLHYLSSQEYQHRFYVDLTPSVGDVYFDDDWHTVLVGGFGAGGKGYFFLDVTDPDDFTEGNAGRLVLGEFGANDPTHGDDLGLSFSKPKIALMNNNRWAAVFGNGYNSESGSAALFIYYFDDNSVKKITATAAVADGADKNGLSTPSLFDLNGDGVADRAYAGDVQGNMWAFDLCNFDAGTGACATNDTDWGKAYAQPLFSTGGEPITTAPRIARNTAVPRGQAPNLLVLFGSGQLLNSDDLAQTDGTAYYGVWDRGQPNLTASKLVEREFEVDTDTGLRKLDQGDPIAWDGGDSTGEFGWYIPLDDGDPDGAEFVGGERVVMESVLLNRLLLFNTAIPVVSDCSSGGTGWLMSVDFLTGLAPTTFAPFDTNGDGILDENDELGFVGVKSPIGTIPSSPAIISTPGQGRQDAIRVTAFDPEAEAEPGGGSGASSDGLDSTGDMGEGRLSWEELSPF